MAAFVRKPVENLLGAKSVAIVGASPKGRWPMGIFRNLKKAYGGKVFLINPNYQEIENSPCYPNVAALPEVPEELLVLIPTRAVLGALEDAANLGTKSATIRRASRSLSVGGSSSSSPRSPRASHTLAAVSAEGRCQPPSYSGCLAPWSRHRRRYS